MRMLYLVEEIEDPEWVYPIASAGVTFAMEHFGQFGVNERLASIACDGNRSYTVRKEAQRYIRDKIMRDSIDIHMSEEESRWYDCDINSGM